MIILGLTGSIGMGKSTTAQMFRDEGIPVYDSDAVVHALYDKGGAAVAIIENLFPGTAVDGRIDRQKLSAHVVHNEHAMQKLEAAVHPLVRAEQEKFLAAARADNRPLVVLDIPLLFETGRETNLDHIVVVTAPPHVQKSRVLERPDMTEEKFTKIHARQLADEHKRQKADFIIHTDKGLDHARAEVKSIIAQLVEN